MKTIFYLKTCNTCMRILKEINAPSTFVLQDIKAQPITVSQLELLHELAGSYEALFSKRAKLYKERDLKNKTLTEDNYKALLLEHYTFLKRPVIVNNNAIFIGNSTKTVQLAKATLHE